MWSSLLSNEPLSLHTVCVFLPVFFSCVTTFLLYLLARDISSFSTIASSTTSSTTSTTTTFWNVHEMRGVLASFFGAIVPGYAYRSIAGLYDHESIGIPLVLLCCLLWISICRLDLDSNNHHHYNHHMFDFLVQQGLSLGQATRIIMVARSLGFAVTFALLSSVWSVGSLFVAAVVTTHIALSFRFVKGSSKLLQK